MSSFSVRCSLHFEYFQLQTRKTFQIDSKNTFSRIFSSRPEFSRIGGDNSKTQKAHFQSCGGHFGACSASRPQKPLIFEHFRHLQRRSLQIAAKSWFSSIFNSRLELSIIRAETSKTQKAHFLSRGVSRKPFWSILSSQAQKGINFLAFSAFAAKIAPDSCEKLIFEHFQLKTWIIKN